jgi:hypothetical protein
MNLDAKLTDEKNFEPIFEFKVLWTYPNPKYTFLLVWHFKDKEIIEVKVKHFEIEVYKFNYNKRRDVINKVQSTYIVVVYHN